MMRNQLEKFCVQHRSFGYKFYFYFTFTLLYFWLLCFLTVTTGWKLVRMCSLHKDFNSFNCHSWDQFALLSRMTLHPFCKASNRLLATSSVVLLWDSDREFPLLPSFSVLSLGPTRDVHGANDATRGWEECARRRRKKNRFPTNMVISALKQWWELFLDVIVSSWPGSPYKWVIYIAFPPFPSFQYDIIFVSGAYTQWEKELAWKKLER